MWLMGAAWEKRKAYVSLLLWSIQMTNTWILMPLNRLKLRKISMEHLWLQTHSSVYLQKNMKFKKNPSIETQWQNGDFFWLLSIHSTDLFPKTLFKNFPNLFQEIFMFCAYKPGSPDLKLIFQKPVDLYRQLCQDWFVGEKKKSLLKTFKKA